MRKTLFSILPLFVFLGPSFAPQLPSIFGLLAVAPPAANIEANHLRRPAAANPVADRIRARISEARDVLESLPADATTEVVTLAVEDPARADELHTLKLDKSDFLSKGAEFTALSAKGTPLRVKIVRPNYVNTAVEVKDAAGRELHPLVVRYPVERGGKLKEVAYYTSAHPAVARDEVVRAGGDYVHERLNEAAARLAAKGFKVSPDIVDVAERLCLVEHTDHKRFKTENAATLFDEVRALYALNAGDTYRYSVSSAGAGGMVQMIPPTYKGIREQNPKIGLKPDFVEGMRDHSNALEAMLVYMQLTWDELLTNEEVTDALARGIATRPELLAAGYNSNPLKLPRYIREGGTGWRTLIPEETKMYLRIYAAVEATGDFRERS